MADADDVAGYLRELAACCPDFAVREARPAQQGWDSLTLLVNGGTIVRFARRPDVAARLAREAALLPRLAEALPVAVPRFTLACPDPAGGLRFVGYPAIPGAPLSAESVTPAAPALAQQLGDFLAALHGFPVEEAVRLGAEGGTAADWRDELTRLYGEVRAHALPRLTSADERARAESLWEGYLGDGANFAFAPTLIHRDLGTEHILHDPATGRLTGVIDWGDASIGDPVQDFTGVYRSLGAYFAQLVLGAYNRPIADTTFWRRVRFYAAIVPFFEIIFGSMEGDEGHVAAGLAAARGQSRPL